MEEYVKSLSLSELKKLNSLVRKELSQQPRTISLEKVWKIIRSDYPPPLERFGPAWKQDIQKRYRERIIEFEDFKILVQEVFPPELMNSCKNNREFTEKFWAHLQAVIEVEIRAKEEEIKASLTSKIKVVYNPKTDKYESSYT